MASKKNNPLVGIDTLSEKKINSNQITNFSVMVLSLIVLFISVLGRINLMDVPLSRDEGTYALLGKMAMLGKIPYIDFYEMKPPMLYYLYGLGGKIFGFSEAGLRILLLVISMTSSYFIFKILQKKTNFSLSLLGAASYSFLSLNLYSLGFALVAEHLVNFLMILTVYFVLSASTKHKYFLAGITLVIGIFTKQTAILFTPAILYLIYQNSQTLKIFAKDVLWFVLGTLSIGLLILVFFLATSSLNEAIFWLWQYPSKYADSISWHEGKDYFSMFYTKISNFQKCTFVCIGLLLLASLIFIKNKLIQSLFLFLLLAFVSVFPGYRFYGQYWLLLFPPLTLLTIISLHSITNKWNKYAAIAVIVPLAIMVDFLKHNEYYLASNKHQEILSFYKGNPFDAIKKLSIHAEKIMNPKDKFMMLGSEPQAYLYANKNPDTKHIFMGMMSRATEKQIPFTNEVLNDIEKTKPEFVLYNLLAYSWMLKTDESSTLYSRSFKLVDNNYTPIAAYNVQEKRYYFENEKDKIDFYKPEQITLLKRK